MFSGILYTHRAGVSAKLSLMHKGKLVARLFENENYDSRFQHVMDIKPFKISKVSAVIKLCQFKLQFFAFLKGDSFLLECAYNTEDRNNFTLVCIN